MGIYITYPDPNVDEVVRADTVLPGPLLLDRIRFRETNIVPSGLRLIHNSMRHTNTTFVFEQEPQYRLISYLTKDYYVPTPWVVYFLTMQNNRMWVDSIMFNNQSLVSADEPLWSPSLPNVYLDSVRYGRVCPNDDAKVIVSMKGKRLRLDITIAGAISGFWASNFNEDIVAYASLQPFMSFDTTHTGSAGYYRGFKNWETLTLDTIMEVPWSQSYSVSDILKQMEWGGEIGTAQPPEYVQLPPKKALYTHIVNALTGDIVEEFLSAVVTVDEDEDGEPEEDDEEYYDEE